MTRVLFNITRGAKDITDLAIKAKKISKVFGKKIALKNVDLEVRKGEIFGLLGPNGAGKTTFLRIVVGLIKPTTGKIRVLGLDPQEDSLTLKKQIAFLPQEVKVYGNLTAKENIEFYGGIYGLKKKRNQRKN